MRTEQADFLGRLVQPRTEPLRCLSVRALRAPQIALAIEGLAAGAFYADLEHGSLDAVQAAQLVRLVAGNGHLGFARSPDPSLSGLEALSNAGVHAVLIPGIHSAAEAAALAAATQHLRDAGLMLGLMIESPQALADCEAMVGMPAFGFFMLGCSDLRRSAAAIATDTEAYAGQAIAQLTRVVRSRGKGMMVGGTWSQTCLQRAAAVAGVDLVSVGSDLSCLRQGLHAVMQHPRPQPT